ncbi:cold shock CspA family protein [Sinobacterium caligoides]|uniref:Cold shock CspA family protein n=1 Tax=Sinobacterium caligoides TaxID=933926 RepID=A0A3N2DYZ8_9GAMM|nr:cold shock domain-containing protein [Sinobacterium caligoides]ROS05091.1 cold shock CspA family protein [Sinobacterium caligoides]
MPNRVTGTIIWFNETEGFGIIEQELGPDAMFTDEALRYNPSERVHEGQLVEFTQVGQPTGLRAEDLICF